MRTSSFIRQILLRASFCCLLPAFIFDASAIGAVDEEVETSPYVILYARRIDIVKVEIERQRYAVDLADANFRRVERLLPSGAASREEYDERYAMLGMAKARLKDLELRVQEEQALYEIARLRIANGLDMPICRVNI
ncbi:MAG: hypothetical protein RIQ81_2304 [Pseudomonadota bacterium]|jgi:hypothetical protein